MHLKPSIRYVEIGIFLIWILIIGILPAFGIQFPAASPGEDWIMQER